MVKKMKSVLPKARKLRPSLREILHTDLKRFLHQHCAPVAQSANIQTRQMAPLLMAMPPPIKQQPLNAQTMQSISLLELLLSIPAKITTTKNSNHEKINGGKLNLRLNAQYHSQKATNQSTKH